MEYRTINKQNQSLLKEILKSPQAYLRAQEKYMNEDDTVPAHFVFGNAVDHFVTEETEFTDKFHIMGNSTVSDTIKKIMDHVFSEVGGTKDLYHNKENFLEDYPDSIVRACGYLQYGQSWKEETRIAKVISTGTNYYRDLIKSKGKTVISQEDYAKAVTCHASMVSDSYISKYLKPGPNQQLIKKQVIQFEYRTVECKGELDLVFIDHDEKTIIPIDVKTIGTNVYSFPYNFWKYRYDFQAAAYSFGLAYQFEDLIKQGYHILSFKFIVCEKDSYNKPLIYTVKDDILNIGMNGGSNSDGKSYEGFEQAIERYLFHTQKDLWDYPMEYYENDGELIIDL